MIIEDLIRTGSLLKNSGYEPKQLLKLTSDVEAVQVRNFFQHIFVVELSEVGPPRVLNKQQWGQEIQQDPKKKKTIFQPDFERAVSAPFVFPSGNPIHPQGVYGVPVFPVFEKHLVAFLDAVDNVKAFLDGRLSRCPSLELDDDAVRKISEALFDEITRSKPDSKGKTLCLIVLADTSSDESPYRYADQQSENSLGGSLAYPGKAIEPDFEKLQSLYSASKTAEGSQQGEREGQCSICGGSDNGKVVSIYCKSWPWFLPTWTCPVSHAGKGKIVEGIALDQKCYEALNIGACYFDKLTRPVNSLVTRELFSPVEDREGRRTVEHKSVSDLTTIFGAVLVLPIIESTVIDQEELATFGEDLRFAVESTSTTKQKHIETVVGFEANAPEGVSDDIYRMTLVYYSGDAGRGDIHLRCVIEDVVPSVMYALHDLATKISLSIPQLCADVLPGSSDKQHVFHASRYRFIPYLLGRAYGGAFVWEQLQSLLRRNPLNVKRPLANVAHRISSLVNRLPATEYDIREEVLFFLAFLDFAQQFNQTIAEGEIPEMTMRNWKELLAIIGDGPPDQMQFENTNELGFACGVLVRQFSRQYWAATKVGREGKDYLKHRIIAFGADLTPDSVWKKAFPTMFNVEKKLNQLNLSDEFRRRVGIAINLCQDQQDLIRRDRDGFMAAFWSGYALQQKSNSEAHNTTNEQGDAA